MKPRKFSRFRCRNYQIEALLSGKKDAPDQKPSKLCTYQTQASFLIGRERAALQSDRFCLLWSNNYLNVLSTTIVTKWMHSKIASRIKLPISIAHFFFDLSTTYGQHTVGAAFELDHQE